ncbi:hypothetical protein KCU95_g12592, partial [Aureobasidium melanogenum]
HSQLKTGHPVRSAIHKQLNGRLVLRWVTTWESLLLYVLQSSLFLASHHKSTASCVTQLDHQTCRGSSIGRACGSYHLIKYNLKVAGSSPAFGYS